MTKKTEKFKRKIGIVGKGFGAIAATELADDFEISWNLGAHDDLNVVSDVDLVYVASPLEFHLEHALFFLTKSTPVIVEKPAVLSMQSLEIMIHCAEVNNTFIYFSDIFNFREDVKTALTSCEEIIWHKHSKKDEWIVARLAYHYLYLLINLLGNDFELNILEVSRNSLIFEINTSKRVIVAKFRQYSDKDVHTIDRKSVEAGTKGAIASMFSEANLEKGNIKKNNQVARQVISLIETIRAKMPTITVVGAGAFGCQAAIQMAKSGLQVTLVERHDEILKEASSKNQYRVHRGYHYPRSNETASECKNAEQSFTASFNSILLKKYDAFYSIATKGSKTKPDEFLSFLRQNNLEHQIVPSQKGCDLTIKAKEFLFDPELLKEAFLLRMNALGIQLKLNSEYSTKCKSKNETDIRVFATYSSLGGFDNQIYQYELCEKPIVLLSKKYANKSFVVMDGPFMCIDPYRDTKYHVMGNVVHAIHVQSNGRTPEIPQNYHTLLSATVIPAEQIANITKFKLFKKTYEMFFDRSEEIKHIGSMFALRTVLPNRDHDDARPTQVSLINRNTIKIFSGKIITCCTAANQTTELAWNLIERNDNG